MTTYVSDAVMSFSTTCMEYKTPPCSITISRGDRLLLLVYGLCHITIKTLHYNNYLAFHLTHN